MSKTIYNVLSLATKTHTSMLTGLRMGLMILNGLNMLTRTLHHFVQIAHSPRSQFEPVYPGGQEQVYCRTPSTHVPKFWQGLLAHWSISVVNKNIHILLPIIACRKEAISSIYQHHVVYLRQLRNGLNNNHNTYFMIFI